MKHDFTEREIDPQARKHGELLILSGSVLLCKNALEGMKHDFTGRERERPSRTNGLQS